MKHEFYDQRKWLKLHKEADRLVADNEGLVILAVYLSPLGRQREDMEKMLKQLQDTNNERAEPESGNG